MSHETINVIDVCIQMFLTPVIGYSMSRVIQMRMAAVALALAGKKLFEYTAGLSNWSYVLSSVEPNVNQAKFSFIKSEIRVPMLQRRRRIPSFLPTSNLSKVFIYIGNI